jgi:mercuric ion transport protein
MLAGLATASCCALPILLGTLGLGSTWLFRLAAIAAPHRTALLIIGAAAIGTAAVLLWRQRTEVCEPGALCAKPGVRLTTSIGLLIGLILLIAGYIYV